MFNFKLTSNIHKKITVKILLLRKREFFKKLNFILSIDLAEFSTIFFTVKRSLFPRNHLVLKKLTYPIVSL